MTRSKRKDNRHKLKKKSKRSTHSRFYGISERDRSYLLLDENVHSIRTGGTNTVQNRFRKQINDKIIAHATEEESDLIAKELIYLEKLYANPNVSYDSKDTVRRKHTPMTKKDYNDIKDDIYYSEIPDDYDALSNPSNTYFDRIRKQLIRYEIGKTNPEAEEFCSAHDCSYDNKTLTYCPSGTIGNIGTEGNCSSINYADLVEEYCYDDQCEDITPFHKKIIKESNTNRGLFSSDKPRGPSVRYAELMKRKACPDGLGKCAFDAGVSLAKTVL